MQDYGLRRAVAAAALTDRPGTAARNADDATQVRAAAYSGAGHALPRSAAPPLGQAIAGAAPAADVAYRPDAARRSRGHATEDVGEAHVWARAGHPLPDGPVPVQDQRLVVAGRAADRP